MELSELIPHLLEHALEDTLYLVPFLFVTYLALEALEHKAGDTAATLIKRAGSAGPVVGALLGAVPQCGFSAAGSALYASRAITLGTLFAVMLSTSDEMVPLFIASQIDPSVMVAILGTKIIIGMIMGFTVDGLLRLRVYLALKREKSALHHTSEPDHICACHRYEGGQVHHQHDNPASPHYHNPHCHCDNAHNNWTDVVLEALKHTLQVSLIVFAISIALVAILEIAGEEMLAEWLAGNPGLAIFGSALVGLIPNCAASVVITQLYLDGMLGTGAMLSGLLVSAGVGLLVLFGENRRPKQNCVILFGLYITGVVWGLLFEAFGITFM